MKSSDSVKHSNSVQAPQGPRSGGDLPAGKWTEVLWASLLLFICAHFSIYYATDHPHLFSLKDYVDGVAKVPYQYRTLIAWLMRPLLRIPIPGGILEHIPTAHPATPYDLYFLLISFLMLAGSVVATRFSFRILTHNAHFSRWSSFLIIYMAYFNLSLAYTNNYTYPYDLSSLFFFCLGIYLVLARKLWIYYPVFVLGVFNRETICFLTFFFCISEWFHFQPLGVSQRLMKLAPHAVAQGLLWLGIKFALFRLYAHNPMEIEQHALFLLKAPYNIAELLKPWFWPLFLSNAGFLLPVIVFGFKWIQDSRIQWACKLLLPFWFVAMVMMGVILEMRVFTEMISIEALAVGLIAFNWFCAQKDLKAVERTSG